MLLLPLLLPLLAPSPASSSDPAVTSEVLVALRNLTRGVDSLLPEEMSEAAFASLRSISNVNMFSERRAKQPVWPYWSLDCAACEAAAALLVTMFEAGTPLWEVEVAITSLCILLEIEAVEVCEGMVHNYGYQVEYIVQHLAGNTSATAELFCGVFVGGECGDTGTVNDWVVEVPGGKPTPTSPDGPPAQANLKVLQVRGGWRGEPGAGDGRAPGPELPGGLAGGLRPALLLPQLHR